MIELYANALGTLDQALDGGEIVFPRPVGVGHIVAEVRLAGWPPSMAALTVVAAFWVITSPYLRPKEQ